MTNKSALRAQIHRHLGIVNIYWLIKFNVYFDVDEDISIHLILAERTFGKKLNLLKKVIAAIRIRRHARVRLNRSRWH